MDFTNALHQLHTEYNVRCVHDISCLFAQNGEQELYNIVKNEYSSKYNDNDRLVFYFDKDDYRYKKTPGLLISQFQQYITDIDISHFFVVVISTDNRVSGELESLCQIHSTEEFPIRHIQCTNIPSKFPPTEADETKLCVMPWLHLHTEPNGDVLPCCDFNKHHPLANIKTTPLDSIINGTNINEVREQMLNGDYISGCKHCYKSEDNNTESLRTKSNKLWNDIYNDLSSRTNTDGSVDDFTLASIDIGLSNVCNFKCRMCSGYHSSKIASEEKEMYGREINVLNLTERREHFPQFMTVLDTIERVYFSGGEPLMMPEHYKVMEYLDKIQHYDVAIECNTNLSMLTYKGKNVVDYWKRFTNVTLTLSIDGIGKHAEYLRHGTVWDQIEKNYIFLLKECGHIRFRINSNINIYNAFNLMSMQHNWITRGLITPEQINMKILIYPDYISIQVLPQTFKDELITQINNHVYFLHNYESNLLITQWQDVLKLLKSNDCSFKLDKFFKHTDELDIYRNESFETTHTEYNELRQHIGE